jgi:hypothetical protein
MGEQTAAIIVRKEIYLIGEQTAAIIDRRDSLYEGADCCHYRRERFTLMKEPTSAAINERNLPYG